MKLQYRVVLCASVQKYEPERRHARCNLTQTVIWSFHLDAFNLNSSYALLNINVKYESPGFHSAVFAGSVHKYISNHLKSWGLGARFSKYICISHIPEGAFFVLSIAMRVFKYKPQNYAKHRLLQQDGIHRGCLNLGESDDREESKCFIQENDIKRIHQYGDSL